MLDGGVGCLDQVGSGLNVAQLCGLAQGVEERGDFGSAFRATAVVILAPNDGSPQSTFGRVIVGVHERVFDEQRLYAGNAVLPQSSVGGRRVTRSRARV